MDPSTFSGTNYPHDFALSQGGLPLGRAASPTRSIASTASSSNSRKRSHDEISAPDTSASGSESDNTDSSDDSDSESRSARRLRLDPPNPAGMGLLMRLRSIYQSFVGAFGWRSAGTDGGRPLGDEEGERASSVRSDAVQRTAGIHVNGDGDLSPTTGSNQSESNTSKNASIGRQNDPRLPPPPPPPPPPPQQLPSPLASEDETIIQKAVPKRSGSKKGQHVPKPVAGTIFRPQQPLKPFNPKARPQKSSNQIFWESLRRRDSQETRPASPNPTTSYRLKGLKTPGKRWAPYLSPSTPRMGSLLSRSVRQPPPSTGARKSERIANRITKPSAKRSPYVTAIARARAESEAESLFLRALLRTLGTDSSGRFLNLEEDRARKRRIDLEVERLRELGQREVIPPLTPEQELEWQKYIVELKADHARRRRKLYITKKFGRETLEIRTDDLATLAGIDAHGGWLNDTIILFYLGLIGERENRQGLRVILHNSFFYPKFLKDNFRGVARWSAKKGASGMQILALDYIVVPICQSSHWTVGVINCKDKRFEYYDSLSHSPPSYHYENFRRYVMGETDGKAELDGWENHWQLNAPKQQNGRDCGVFVIKTAEVVSRGAKPSWNGAESEMRNLRKRMLLEIIHGELMPPPSDDE